MFSFHCPNHGTAVLVWPSDIDDVLNGTEGIGLQFHCSCGFRGLLVERVDGSEHVVALAEEVVLRA